MRKPPCYKCTIHTATCHSDCDDYKTWRNELDEANAKKREADKIGVAIAEVHRAKVRSKNRNLEKKMRGGDK